MAAGTSCLYWASPMSRPAAASLTRPAAAPPPASPPSRVERLLRRTWLGLGLGLGLEPKPKPNSNPNPNPNPNRVAALARRALAQTDERPADGPG